MIDAKLHEALDTVTRTEGGAQGPKSGTGHMLVTQMMNIHPHSPQRTSSAMAPPNADAMSFSNLLVATTACSHAGHTQHSSGACKPEATRFKAETHMAA